MGFWKSVRRVLAGTFVLALGLLGAVVPVTAQGPLGSDLLDLGRDDDRSLMVERRAPAGDGSPSLGAFGQRLGLGFVDLGLRVAPRRFALDTPAEAASPATRYRLAETDFAAADVGVDFRLRWPTRTGALEPRLSSLQPYLSLGPAFSGTLGEDLMPLSRPASTGSDPGMSVGMRGSIGLTWQLAPDTSLFGEYRLIHDRAFTGRHGGDVGTDLFYGLSVRF